MAIDWDTLVAEKKEPSEKLRTAAQGLLFGFADELEARLRAGIDQEEYERLLDEIRGNIDEYRKAKPIESTAFEIGGAVVPAIAATILTGGGALAGVGAKLATQFPKTTGLLQRGLGKIIGTKGADTVIGGAAVGGAQGALEGFGSGEGDFVNRAVDATLGAGTGATLGGAVTGAGNVLQKSLGGLIDHARQKFGERAAAAAQRELQRIAQERGITAEAAFDLIESGALLAENATLRDVMRTYRAQGGEAAEVLREGLTDRPSGTSKDVKDVLQRGLGGSDENILNKSLADLTTIKDRADELYDSPMGKKRVPQNVLLEMARVFRNAPDVFGPLKREFKSANKKFPFELKDGQIIVKPNKNGVAELTIMDAEILRRNLRDAAKRFDDRGEGGTAKNLRAMKEALEVLIDDISEDTKAARETYRNYKQTGDAFDDATKLLTQTPDFDKFENAFDLALAQGNDQLKAFRLGVLAQLRRKLQSGSRASTIKSLQNEDHSLGMAIKHAFPEQNYAELIEKLKIAKDANEAANQILGGSPTAITEALMKREGIDADLMDVALGNSMLLGAGRLLFKMVKKTQPGLNDRERTDLVKLMLSTDAEEIKRIISSDNAYSLLEDKLANYISGAKAGLTRGGTQVPPRELIDAGMGMFGVDSNFSGQQ